MDALWNAQNEANNDFIQEFFIIKSFEFKFFEFKAPKLKWSYYDAQVNRYPNINPTYEQLPFDKVDCKKISKIIYWEESEISFIKLNNQYIFDFKNTTIGNGYI